MGRAVKWVAAIVGGVVLMACAGAHAVLPQTTAFPMPLSGEELLSLDAGKREEKEVARILSLPGMADVGIHAGADSSSAVLWAQFWSADGKLVAEGQPPLSIQHLPPADYLLSLRLRRGRGKVRLATVVSLHNPEARSGADSSPDGARELLSGETVHDSVSWFELDCTDHLRFSSPVAGRWELLVALDNVKGAIELLLTTSAGEELRISPGKSLSIEELQPGDHLLRIRAAEAASADYWVTASFEPLDPDGAPEGATALLPAGTVDLLGELNPARGDAEDWFRFELDVVALLTLNSSRKNGLRPSSQDPAEPTLQWWNEELSQKSFLKKGAPIQLQPGAHFLQISNQSNTASESASPYSFRLRFHEIQWIETRILERQQRRPCVLLVNRGHRQGVRRGAAAQLLDPEELHSLEISAPAIAPASRSPPSMESSVQSARGGPPGSFASSGRSQRYQGNHGVRMNNQGVRTDDTGVRAQVSAVYPTTALLRSSDPDCDWGKDTVVRIRSLSPFPQQR